MTKVALIVAIVISVAHLGLEVAGLIDPVVSIHFGGQR